MKALWMALAALLAGGTLLAQNADWTQSVNDFEAQGFSGIVLQTDSGIVATYLAGEANSRESIPTQSSTRYRLGYLTELYTAVPVYQLIDQGNFDLETPINALMPNFYDSALNGVTVYHLLTHTSGLADTDSLLTERMTAVTMIRECLKDKSNHHPVGEYHPSKANYLLLGQLVQKYMMKPWQFIIEDGIVRALGLENTDEHERGQLIDHLAIGYNCTEEQCLPETAYCIGNLGASGCMYATAQELFAAHKAFCDGTFFDTALLDKTDELARQTAWSYPGMRVRQSTMHGFQGYVAPGIVILSNNDRPLNGLIQTLTNF